MQVALPELLSVMAHELRSPLAVIQGYIRLLQRQRPASDPDLAMLAAMLEATSRLADIGRTASDLSRFLSRTPVEAPASVPVHALLADVANDALGIAVVDSTRVDGGFTIQTTDRALLARAIALLAELAMREAGQRSVTVVATQQSADLCLTMLPNTPVGDAEDHVADTADGHVPVNFDSGGLGLGLVLASYILESHLARATMTGEAGRIDLRIPTERRPS